MTFTVEGVEDARKLLSKHISSIEGSTAEGIELAAKFIEARAKELTSKDEGVLENSTFVKMVDTQKGPAALIGYTAGHAAAVHEMPDNTNWNKPGAENKFLEKAVVRNLTKIINIIKNVASKING